MESPTLLYQSLSKYFKSKDYIFVNRGDGMWTGCMLNGSSASYLLNEETQEAWEIISPDGKLSLWATTAVNQSAIADLPEDARLTAEMMRAPYFFGIYDCFKDGVACYMWTLQPDGRYYADEDGFGMTNDVEINLYGFLCKSAEILIPFQPMDKELRQRFREQAVAIARYRAEHPYTP